MQVPNSGLPLDHIRKILMVARGIDVVSYEILQKDAQIAIDKYWQLDQPMTQKQLTERKKELMKFYRDYFDAAQTMLNGMKYRQKIFRSGIYDPKQGRERQQDIKKLHREVHGLKQSLRRFENTDVVTASVTVMGKRFDEYTEPQAITLGHPGKGKKAFAELTITGLEGDKGTIVLEHIPGKDYGGHLHRITPYSLGQFKCKEAGVLAQNPSMGRAEFTIPQGKNSIKLTFKSTDVCARIMFIVRVQSSAVPLVFHVDVKYKVELIDLNKSNVPYLHLYTNDKQHPSEVSHYGTKSLIERLKDLNTKFKEAIDAGEFDHKDKEGNTVRPEGLKIFVNDMSLPWGGTFKTYGVMQKKGEHAEHKWGNCVDISYKERKGCTAAVKRWLKKKSPDVFKVTPLLYSSHMHFNLTKRKKAD